MNVRSKNLELVPRTREQARAALEQLSSEERAMVSAAWLTLLEASSAVDPWVHGFLMLQRGSEMVIGQCGFKGPPDADGMVEIAYCVSPEHQGRGYATEAAAALVDYAFGHGEVRVVRAHTSPEPNASTRVLTKSGFRHVGEVLDPDDGLVWRWERSNDGQ